MPCVVYLKFCLPFEEMVYRPNCPSALKMELKEAYFLCCYDFTYSSIFRKVDMCSSSRAGSKRQLLLCFQWPTWGCQFCKEFSCSKLASDANWCRFNLVLMRSLPPLQGVDNIHHLFFNKHVAKTVCSSVCQAYRLW